MVARGVQCLGVMLRRKMDDDGWILVWMSPLYGAGGVRGQQRGFAEKIYAPDLEQAFAQARTRWPSAHGWECLGRVDRRHPTSVDARDL